MGFAKDFVWGAATSSYQIEGTGRDSGKGQNIWDVFTKEPGRVYEGHTGDIACDHYHRFREDVAYMKELGLKEEDYSFYLDLRKYGSTRHAGFGLGFERCVMYLTGMGNIRDVIPFPRTVNNCEL